MIDLIKIFKMIDNAVSTDESNTIMSSIWIWT